MQDDGPLIESGDGAVDELMNMCVLVLAGDDPCGVEDEDVGAAPLGEMMELAGGDTDMRADDDEAACGGGAPRAGGFDLGGGERGVSALTDALADERRADPVNESRACLFGADEGE